MDQAIAYGVWSMDTCLESMVQRATSILSYGVMAINGRRDRCAMRMLTHKMTWIVL